MTVPLYPSNLPRPLRQGFQVTFPDGRQQTQPEVGPPRTSLRFSSAATPVAMVTDLTRDQLARFWRFWSEDTSGGALPFLIADPTANDWPLLSADGEALTTGDGTPILISAWWLVVFGRQPPIEVPVGIRFRLQFSLMVMP
jgi:hypothetical protein